MCVFQRGNDEIYNDTEKSKSKRGPLTMENLKFNTNITELKELMQLRSTEAKQKLDHSYGGIDGLAEKLCSNLKNGITDTNEEISQRVITFGKNEIKAKKSRSLFALCMEATKDPTLIMLIICAIISIGLSFYHPEDEALDEEYRHPGINNDKNNLEWVEGVAIMIAVVVVVFVTAFNDWRKERQFRGLQDQIDHKHMTSVIRDGIVKQICVKELVVGDVCLIKYGDLVPTDGIVTQANDLKIDESSITGETDQIKKDLFENVTVLSGTHVMEGSGQFIVTAVGLNSQTGIIMALLGATDTTENGLSKKINKKNVKSKVTPEGAGQKDRKKTKVKKVKKHRSVLQVKLGKLALQIGYVGMLSALCTFLILCFRMAVDEFIIKQKKWSSIYIKHIISYLIQAITVIVVAVPEGLPLAVALALSFAVQRMTKDNNLVRHLDACETMGNATTICSDKTGTLTTNRMTAVQCWISDTHYTNIPQISSFLSSNVKDFINESISVNSNYASMIEAPKLIGAQPRQIGNKTECGLLGFVSDLGGDYNEIRRQHPNENFSKVYTFNSTRKMMATAIQNGSSYRLHAKGASEIVLAKCSYYLDASGKAVSLDEAKKKNIIKNIIEKMACDGLRTICVAYRDFSPISNEDIDLNNESFKDFPKWDDEESVISNLTCLCIVGIEDPVRAEVPDAIRKCQTSGVVVRMVTGDNLNTATSIAIKCGIIKPSDSFLILESKEFNKRIRSADGEVDQDLLDKVWPNLRVLARSSPQDKYNLINGIVESRLSSNREVVAVTGDGTNDGPALKRADVGFAMGIQGTDVAKEASDIILTDDNFSSIVKAVMWGRNVYDAIAKFLQFQLTANFAAGLFSVICAFTIQAVPLKAVQMLWVNLVMDTLASLALATEPPTEDLLKRKPYGRNKAIISVTMLKNIFFHTIYQIVVLFGLVWGIEGWMQVDSVIKYNDINKLKQPSLHFTIIFNAFVLMTLFNEINGRKIHNERNVFDGIRNNLVFIIIWLFCFIGQILIVNFGGIVFAVVKLDLDHWMWCILFGIGSLLWGQLVITLPTYQFKKVIYFFMCRKRKTNIESISLVKETEEEEDEDELIALKRNDEEIDMEIEKGFLNEPEAIWLRGANRIANQLQIVDALNQKVNEANSIEMEED